MVTMSKANTAPAKFTKDSSPSDRRPTDPVTYQAPILRIMVRTAVQTEISSRVLGRGIFMARAGVNIRIKV